MAEISVPLKKYSNYTPAFIWLIENVGDSEDRWWLMQNTRKIQKVTDSGHTVNIEVSEGIKVIFKKDADALRFKLMGF
jgi:hypothetical protein